MVVISRSRYEQSSAEVAALQESSPFKNGEAEAGGARIDRVPGQAPYMGVVHTEGGQLFFVRIGCEHMAEVDHVDAVDCRYHCEARERDERARAAERERRWRA